MSSVAYETRLDGDRRWALREGGMHFERQSVVFRSLERVAQRLGAARIPYAVVGGMALYLHGYRRFTEVVDILVTGESLRAVHCKLDGHGFLPPFEGSRNLRDAGTGVRIEFIVTGEFPGDGQPKAVAFPDPAVVAERMDDVDCIRLSKLIELELASGTSPSRLRDLADVQELIRHLRLPAGMVDELDPSVRSAYTKLWQAVQLSPEDEPT